MILILALKTARVLIFWLVSFMVNTFNLPTLLRASVLKYISEENVHQNKLFNIQ